MSDMSDMGDTGSGTDPAEDALARAAALGPLPGIHDDDESSPEDTPIGQSVKDEGDDLTGFNLRG
jgi:hypothetical protein